MYLKVIPEEYSHDGNKRYKTECARYNAIYDEISKCEKQERDNLELLLKCDKAYLERCSEIKGIVSILLTVTLTTIALLNPFIEKILSITDLSYIIKLFDFTIVLLKMVLLYSIILYNKNACHFDRCC